METNILKLISIADLASIGNAICGILAIFAILRSDVTLTAYLLLLALAFDSVDGFLARRFNSNPTNSLFGMNIDSLADIISFGVAPAIIIYMFSNDYWIIIVSIIIMVCGLLRLTRFNMISQQQIRPSENFLGLPIPITAVTMASLLLASVYNVYLVSILFIIISVLMITEIPYPKLRDLRLLVLPVIIGALAIIPSVNSMLRYIPSYLLIIIALLYIFGSIVYPYIANRFSFRYRNRQGRL